MKSTFSKSTIAMAIAAITATGAAVAGGVSSTTTNLATVEMTKKLELSKDITINGGVIVNGTLVPDSSAVAVIDNKQFNSGNSAGQSESQNLMLTNTATSGGDMLSGSAGNLGVNMNSGDNNMQDNAAALASADSSFVFGLVDAEVFVRQAAEQNTTVNQSVDNTASIGAGSFQTAAGNIGANYTAGNSNLQKNNFASSVANAGVAEASVNTQQYSTGNITTNRGEYVPVDNGVPGVVTGEMKTQSVTLTGDLTGFDLGTMGGNYGNAVEQNGDLVPADPIEESGSFTVGGVPAGQGTYTANHYGSLNAGETSTYNLGATFTGAAPYYEITECGFCNGVGGITFATNTVKLDNQAFMNASGKIGANMASGTGNMQSNSMAITTTPAQ